MDAAEFGAYMSLIVACYQAGGQLINDDSRLARMARCTPHKWRKIRPVIEGKFLVSEKIWTHNFIKSDIKRCESLSKKNKANRLKGKQRGLPVVDQSCDQTATNTSNKEQVTNIRVKKKKDSCVKKLSDEFLEFWKLYPRQRRGDRDQANRAWKKVLKDKKATEREMIDGVTRYGNSREVRKGYGKGAAAWLSAGKYRDSYAEPTADGKQSYSSTILHASQRAREQLSVQRGEEWPREAISGHTGTDTGGEKSSGLLPPPGGD